MQCTFCHSPPQRFVTARHSVLMAADISDAVHAFTCKPLSISARNQNQRNQRPPVTEFEDVELETGYPYQGRGVLRLEFNDMGKVTRVRNIDESRFIMEQLGYQMTR